MNATETIARYVTSQEYADLPQGAVEIVKSALLDFLGVCFSGVMMPEGMIIDYVQGMGGPPEAVVIGGGYRAPANMAALANGMLAAAPDSSDTSLTWNVGHPTEVLMPALLALGDRSSRSGKDLITSYIIGFEVGSRIGTSLNRHYTMGWHTTATVGAFAAAAASSRILDLGLDQVRNALGMAGSMAFGLKLNLGTGARSLHTGRAAQSGIMAAELARAGLTANTSILEGPTGYVNIMGGSEPLLDQAVAGLGRSLDILGPGGLSFKLHACCYMAAWCVDAMLYLADKHKIRINDIDHITCRIPRPLAQTLNCHRPQIGGDGMYSMEYCMAAAILDHRLGLAQFTDEKVLRPEAQALFDRVELAFPEETVNMGLSEAFRQASSVTVRLQSGKELTHEVRYPKGDIRNPITDVDAQDKFREFSARLLSRGQQDEIIRLCRNLDSLERVSEISRALLKITK